MGLCSLIEYTDDQEAKDLVSKWDFLYEGYKKMDIGNLSLSNPSFTSKSKTIPVTEILDDLVCKIDQMTGELKDHYILVAKVHPDFRKYWEGETTYTKGAAQLSQQKRKIFRSFKSFFEDNEVEKRIEFCRHLDYFSAYHEKTSIPIDLERRCRHLNFPDDITPIVMPAITVFLTGITALGSLLISHPAAIALQALGAYAVLYLFGNDTSSGERRVEQNIFKEIAHDPLVRSAEISDKVINYIK